VAETLLQFQTPVLAPNGARYVARACGAVAPDGLWQGWLEFTPALGGAPVRSGRETTQPNRADAVYWATGLSAVYLEGALKRALEGPVRRPIEMVAPPLFAQPAPAITAAAPDREPIGHAVLDPFSVFQKGELLLRRQLAALSSWHLVNIVNDYELSDQPGDALMKLSQAALIEVIVEGVRNRLDREMARTPTR
jgi:hypothetical protein